MNLYILVLAIYGQINIKRVNYYQW